MDKSLIDTQIETIQAAFRSAGSYITQHAGKVAATYKERDDTPVTEVDTEIERRVMEAFGAAFPDMPMLGEETGYDEHQLPGACWIIDPIDGTRAFIENRPTYTCMALLIVHGEATASIIYNPTTTDMFVAKRGGGAWRNGQKLELSSQLPHRVICKAQDRTALEQINWPTSMTLDSDTHGAGYTFSMIASGDIAARINLHGGGYIHDYATGVLLVQEAGGTIIPIKDTHLDIRTRSFVACHPDLEPTIQAQMELLRQLED